MGRPWALMAVGLLVTSFASSSSYPQGRDKDKRLVLVDPNLKRDPALVYLVVTFLGKQQVYALHPEGGERVSTALRPLQPFPRRGDQRYGIWVVRPGREDTADLVLPVDWDSVSAFIWSDTDYPLEPGDRVYVCPRLPEGARLIWIWAPEERIRAMIQETRNAVWKNLGNFFGWR